MNIEKFRREVEKSAEMANATMANESMSDSNEEFVMDLTFDETDPVRLQQMIQEGVPVTGHVYWRGGFRSPFEAHKYGWRVVARFGPWEMPQA
jgi:hypothetical protein